MFPKSIRLSIIISVVVVGVVFSLIHSIAQSVDNLTDLRNKLLKEIELSNAMLNDAKEAQNVSLKKILLLNNQINKRKAVIEIYNSQIANIQLKISSTDSSINVINSNINRIKREYEALILESYKRRKSFTATMFFFSSNSFNQAYQRYLMIQQLNEYRKNQVVVLKAGNDALKKKREELVIMLDEVRNLMGEVKKQSNTLEKERNHQQTNISLMQRKEQILRAQLKEKQAKEKELEQKIIELIEAEAKNKDVKPSQFDKSKGKLDWPLKNGLVISEFGEHPHPVLKGLQVKNNGIDIQASGDSNVYCVFDGEVSRVVGIPGYNKAVIIRHGKFLTVYANLSDVDVKSGTKVSKGSKIGKVFYSDSEKSEVLHFEIWEESNKINPVIWLKR